MRPHLIAIILVSRHPLRTGLQEDSAPARNAAVATDVQRRQVAQKRDPDEQRRSSLRHLSVSLHQLVSMTLFSKLGGDLSEAKSVNPDADHPAITSVPPSKILASAAGGLRQLLLTILSRNDATTCSKARSVNLDSNRCHIDFRHHFQLALPQALSGVAKLVFFQDANALWLNDRHICQRDRGSTREHLYLLSLLTQSQLPAR